MKKIVFLISLFTTFCVFSQVGSVSMLRGLALKGEVPLEIGDEVFEGDTIFTKNGAFIRLKMHDNTLVNLGPDSSLIIKSYKVVKEKRKNLIKLLNGKMRVMVREFAKEGESIQFDSQQVSLGVRGTEFLSNTYMVGGAPSTDTLLLKGSLKVSGTGFNSFDMEPGQYFNSQDIIRSGMSAVKKMAPELLRSLKESAETLLPTLQTSAGFISPVDALTSVLMPSFGSSGSSNNDEEKKPSLPKEGKKNIKKVVAPKKNQPKKSRVNGPQGFQYDLKKEPWDIRDAVLNRDKNKAANKCFYYFYKKLPGSGEPERFRRERDCDEFEYDL